MTDYRELAAAELDKVRAANDERAVRGQALREDGKEPEADAADAVVAEMSFRLAGAYTALAALERAAVTPDPGQE